MNIAVDVHAFEMVIPFVFKGRLYQSGSVLVVFKDAGREAYRPDEWERAGLVIPMMAKGSSGERTST